MENACTRNWRDLIKPKKLDSRDRDADADLRQVRRRAARARLRHHPRQLAAADPAVLAPGRGHHGGQIEGVLHEFSTIPGVVEDVTDIILNLKEVRLKLHADGTEDRCASRPRATARSRPATSSPTRPWRSSTPTTTSPPCPRTASCEMELTVKTGRGYVPAERNKDEDAPIGTIPIDAIFSPVRKVNYTVTNARVGQQTDYDKLTLEVWTDGSRPARGRGGLRGQDPQGPALHLHQLRGGPRSPTEARGAARGARSSTRTSTAASTSWSSRCAPPTACKNANIKLHRRAGAEDRGGDAQDQELRPQVAQRDQEILAEMGLHLGMKLDNFHPPCTETMEQEEVTSNEAPQGRPQA